MLKFINNGDMIVDVGCSNGIDILDVKHHLETHDINITAIGIETHHIDDARKRMSKKNFDRISGCKNLSDAARKKRQALDAFIHRPVAYADDIDGTADIVTCFGFSCMPKNNKESYRKMCMFLKPDGKAVYSAHKSGKDVQGVAKYLWRAIGGGVLLGRDQYLCKMMTKQDAILHAKECVSDTSNGAFKEGNNGRSGTVLKVYEIQHVYT